MQPSLEFVPWLLPLQSLQELPGAAGGLCVYPQALGSGTVPCSTVGTHGGGTVRVPLFIPQRWAAVHGTPGSGHLSPPPSPPPPRPAGWGNSSLGAGRTWPLSGDTCPGGDLPCVCLNYNTILQGLPWRSSG